MDRTRARLLALLALLGLLAGLLTGCNDSEAETAPEPTTAASSPTPTESSTPTSSPTPERETVREFLERWAEVDKRMQNTGETAEYRSMTPGCEGCTSVADRIEEIYAAGGNVETGGWRLVSIDRNDPVEGRRSVTFTQKAAPTKLVERRGAEPETLPGGRLAFRVEMKRADRSWQIVYLAQVSR